MLSRLKNISLYRFYPLFKYKILGHSMSPTLGDGQIVFVNRLSYFLMLPKVGDIIAAKVQGKVLIKRITKIEDNKFFLSGDNSQDSYDSKKFGLILKKQIIGRVISLK